MISGLQPAIEALAISHHLFGSHHTTEVKTNLGSRIEYLVIGQHIHTLTLDTGVV